MDQEVSRTPEDEEVLEVAIKSFLLDLHTCMPGKIVEYYPETQKADIQPLIKRLQVHEDGTEFEESLPVLPDVPIQFQRGGGFFVTFPLAVGDLVELHFQERSIDNYLSGDGEDTNPEEFRHHDLSDAVAVPGFYPFKLAIKDIDSANFVMGKDEGGIQIHLTPDGTMELKHDGSAPEAAALGNAMKTWWDSVVKPWLATHVHPTGVGPSGPATSPPPEFAADIISKFFKLVK